MNLAIKDQTADVSWTVPHEESTVNQILMAIKATRTFYRLSLKAVLLTFFILNSSFYISAQGTAFTYQGRLNDNGSPADGIYTLTFSLFGTSSGPPQIGNTITYPDIGVTNGLFTVTLDFGANFPGAERWLEVGVSTNGNIVLHTLSPRQKVTATPYAITASSLTGTLPAAQLIGTVPAANLPANVALLDRNPQTFTGTNIFSAKVGIGTTGPQALLHVGGNYISTLPTSIARFNGAVSVNGTVLSEEGNFLARSPAGSGAASLSLDATADSGGTAWFINSHAAGTPFDSPKGSLTFYNGLDRMAITATGKIGIGTATPHALLHVGGSALIEGLAIPSSSFATNLLNLGSGVTSDGLRNGISFFETSTGPTMSLGYDGTGSSAVNALRIYDNSGVGMFTFEASGEMGIGTNAPVTALHVVDSGDTQISVESRDAGGHRWTLQSSRVAGNAATDASLQVIDRTLNASRLLIDTNGNVGIGTTAPTGRLHVSGPSGDDSVVLPAGSISATEMFNEPGLTSDIVGSFGLSSSVTGLAVVASRQITCPAAGFIVAIGTVELLETSSDDLVSVGISESISFNSSCTYQHTVLHGKNATVTVQAVFAVSSGSTTKTIRLLVQPENSNPSHFTGPTHLTLMYFPTGYGTVDSD